MCLAVTAFLKPDRMGQNDDDTPVFNLTANKNALIGSAEHLYFFCQHLLN